MIFNKLNLPILIKMRCETKGHSNYDIQYVCQSPGCDCLPLCKQCKKNHHPEHYSYMIRYDVAVQKALKNLDAQILKLQEYIAPIEKKKQTLIAVQKQIDALKQDKRKLIKRIEDQINKEIRILQEKNEIINTQEKNFYNELKKKMDSLEDMKEKVDRQVKILRSSLTMQIEHYLYYVGKNNPAFTKVQSNQRGDVNIAQLYVKTEHQMILSQLEIRKQILNPKMLKKVNNDSPLYFLIDPKYQTGKYLHYFIPQQNSLELRIYDVERQKWSKHINRNFTPANSQYSTLYDHFSNRFYFVCGKSGYRATNQVIWYDLDSNKWSKATINVGRCNPMLSLISLKPQRKTQRQRNYLLIAGGFDEDNKAMKSWELFDPLNQYVHVQGDMNFASAAGRLVVFDGDTVFKIGGFANRSQSQLGICPIVQKCDFSGLKDGKTSFNFSYIEVQDISKENANNLGKKQYRLYYGGQGAIQINPNEIFIYGGQLSNGSDVDESYILNVEKFPIDNYKGQRVTSTRYYARWINEKPLISGMNFKDFSPCIWKGKLYSLQHLPGRENEVYKGLIEFDMKSWYETENIVDDRL